MKVLILGTRGIPSAHGGFETLAEQLALYLTERGHSVTVYGQVANSEKQYEDTWEGIDRIQIPAPDTPRGTMTYDLKSVLHSVRRPGVVLTLGYNTGILSLLYRLRGKRTLMNMDGIEWRRDKWSVVAKLWLWLNEWLGARFAEHLIADHPEIKKHLLRHTRSSKITVIPYTNLVSHTSEVSLAEFGFTPQDYHLVIARPEPENSILEIVRAFSREPRLKSLVVLGKYRPDSNPYHRAVLDAASPQVRFLGAIYEKPVVNTLRRNAATYVHGHRVGGTNPSLVEALSFGNAIIAHDNRFNRWVAGPCAGYFKNEDELASIFGMMDTSANKQEVMGMASIRRFEEAFTPEHVLRAYETLLLQYAKD